MTRSPRPLAELFIRQSVNRLQHDYLPKLARCVDMLDEDQLWWRPDDACNSVGNLLLHLAGNIRQWIVHGLGGAPDLRERDGEFTAVAGAGGRDLMGRLEGAVAEAVAVIEGLGEDDLRRSCVIQGYRNTGLSAVYHVVEHFSGHVGQVIWITKMLTRRDLGFYAL